VIVGGKVHTSGGQPVGVDRGQLWQEAAASRDYLQQARLVEIAHRSGSATPLLKDAFAESAEPLQRPPAPAFRGRPLVS